MFRYPTLIATMVLLLGSSAWAQYYPNNNHDYSQGRVQQIPPGHFYCTQHREICTHGLSTPEVTTNGHRNYRGNRGYRNGYGRTQRVQPGRPFVNRNRNWNRNRNQNWNWNRNRNWSRNLRWNVRNGRCR